MKNYKDYFYRKAKKEKYPARSVYKLEYIDKKYNLIKKGMQILDFGCSPGSWTKYCSEKTGKEGLVVGIDKKKMKECKEENIKYLKRDIYELELADIVKFSDLYDVILSDMAPSTTGVKEVDQINSFRLAEKVCLITEQLLRKDGCLVCKIFQSQNMVGLIQKLKRQYKWVKTVKPPASRKESYELFIVAYYKK